MVPGLPVRLRRGRTAAATARCPSDVAEVLRDFAEVARAGAVGDESEETEEDAYAELVEFVRVGVQLVYDELAACARRSRPPRRATDRTQHSSWNEHTDRS